MILELELVQDIGLSNHLHVKSTSGSSMTTSGQDLGFISHLKHSAPGSSVPP